ncbi:MAG TPA: TetR/AcrR family transcriptional regulator [Actinomycetota bacterium]|nr:TetR/AcrR family transcriptional regulator [Actinomycetota bacterium]
MEPARRRPGRPRSEAVDRAIVDATFELLAEKGYRGLSMEGVAARAGVGKATVYRRWPSKVALVLDAATASVASVRDPDTGSVREDVHRLLAAVVKVLTGSLAGRVLPWLVAERLEDPELREALRGFWAARRGLMFAVLERGIDRGELPPDLDREVVADLLYGPIHYRFLVSGGPLSREFLDRLVDQVMRLVAGPTRRRRSR